MGTQKEHFTQLFFWINLLYRQNNYVYLIKKYHPHWIMTNIVAFPQKKTTFLWKVYYTTFFLDKVLLCTQNKNKYFFFLQCHLKAEGCSVSEQPRVIPLPKNLRKKLLCELRKCSLTAPQKCNCCSISRHKTLFTIKKVKHHSKWLTSLERYD